MQLLHFVCDDLPLGAGVGKGTWDPLSSHVVGAGMCGELEDSSLSVGTGRDDL